MGEEMGKNLEKVLAEVSKKVPKKEKNWGEVFAEEIDALREDWKDMLKSNGGEYALYHKSKRIGFYDDYMSARDAGKKLSGCAFIALKIEGEFKEALENSRLYYIPNPEINLSQEAS